ncbi:MAG: hypothetical protein IKF35_01060 [Solobacterium sp.]|nr:hypothetical protein [Solobacterium sp.]
MKLADIKKEMQDEPEEEESRPQPPDPATLAEINRQTRKRLQYFRTVYYTLGSVFMIAGIRFFIVKEPVTGIIFLALSSVISLFGRICESAMKNI